MPLLTTKDIRKMLFQADPEGNRIVSFRVFDETRPDVLVAHGEIDFLWAATKNAQQTEEGDKDIVRLDIKLNCEQ